ncbi:CFEM domain-containing protein [Mycena kentingensis (nom. inval.)]|nr:CFEM domain-containing protein [Mycena kentingensis (nom. inval.)]
MRFAVVLSAFVATALAQSSVSGANSASSPASASGSATGSAAAPSGSADLSALTPCILGCINAAAADSPCGSFTNVSCVCTDADFQFKSGTCFQAECQASEVGPALALQSANCGTQSATAAPTASTPFLPSNSAADISATGSAGGASQSGSASGSGSGAGASQTPGAAVPGALPGLGLVSAITAVGALLGAAFVL